MKPKKKQRFEKTTEKKTLKELEDELGVYLTTSNAVGKLDQLPQYNGVDDY
ncbi:hypothetical protein LCL95_04465 [Bacillus timonensis]|nr:hypothetical protein [Bacillus timonensis]